MRRYSDDEEERVRALALVREWTRSNLLDAAQGDRLAADLHLDLRRTNPFLRAGLALFTALIIAAFVGLVITFLELRSNGAVAVVAGLAAIACFVIADWLVAAQRCYRFGVEEMFAMAAVVLLGIGGYELVLALHASAWWHPSVAGLLLLSAGSFGLYRRFGFIYAGVGSVFVAAAIPFQLDLAASVQRALAAAAIGTVFAVARSKRLTSADGYPGDEYGDLQAAALAGVYGVLNVQISRGAYAVTGWFYWSTYVVTWILPIVGLRLGIRDRDRELMDVSLLLALVTLVTSKPYLGWTRNTWDPIVFGIALIGGAVAVRRWLDEGPGGERRGLTAAQLLAKDGAALSLMSAASALVPPGVMPGAPPPRAEPPAPEFGGGRSGGAGGADRY